MKQPVKSHPGWHPLGKRLFSRQERRQGGANMGVAAGLGPGQCPGVATQIRKVRRKGLRDAHEMAPSARKKKSSGEELTPEKKVPLLAGTIGKSIRLEPWEGELAWGGLVGNFVYVRVAETPVPRQVWQKMTQQWDTTVANDEKPTEKA